MNENRKINCLIVDDEPPAREVITRYIANVPMLHLAGECSNAIQALSFLQSHPVDLLFLDIRMPQLNGNDLLKIIKNPPKVIFTTAHAEYALEGYDLDVADYLLKPVQFERFLKAVHKATQNVQLAGDLAPSVEISQEAFVYFRADRKMVKVMLKNILYIESMKDYIKVFTKDQVIITKQSITSVEAMLPKHLFIRTHRSFIVAMHSISSFTNELIEISGAEIPIGKLFRNEVLRNISIQARS
jgi:two-component system, LytTR family, response regulator